MITAKLRSQLNQTIKGKKRATSQPNELKSTSQTNFFTPTGTKGNEKYLLTLKIVLRCTGEKFTATNCSIRMKIRELKSLLEFVCGIPANIQRLCYLDEGEMMDGRDLQYYELIDGGTINMDIYIIYAHLVRAVVLSNFDDVLKQGVSSKVEWNAPAADYMYQREKLDYIAERAGIVLFIASHRGRVDIVEGLISHNVNLNSQTVYGRTAIMVSVVANQTEVINLLLKNNADVDICDTFGLNAVDIAKQFNNKLGQHTLIEFKWRKRAEAEMKAKQEKANEGLDQTDLRAGYQMFDSSQKTWLKGNYAQVYMMHLEPALEFSGSGISAPKSTRLLELEKRNLERKNLAEVSETSLESNSKGAFDKWLAEKERIENEHRLEETEKRYLSKELPTRNNNQKLAKLNHKSENVNNNDEDADRSLPQKYSKKWNDVGLDGNSNQQMQNIRADTSGSKQKNIKTYKIYEGMSYEEWVHIRDNFLQTHNLN